MCLALNSDYLYVTTNSTAIYYYYIINYSTLKLHRTIQALNEGSFPIPCSLKTSGYFYSDFIAQIITINNTEMYLQIIDNNSPNTSCIFQKAIPYNSYISMKFFNSTVIILQTQDLLTFQLTNIEFFFKDNTLDCQPGKIIENITVTNPYNSVNLSIQLEILKKPPTSSNDLSNSFQF